MAILWCNKCGYFREVRNEYTGKSVSCPQCRQPSTVHDTIQILKSIVQKYREQNRVLKHLKELLSSPQRRPTAGRDPSPEPPPAFHEAEEPAGVEPRLLADIDIHNTTTLADPDQYAPIAAWMKNRRISLDINHQALDTTGFFDEVAIRMGDNYETLKPVGDRLKYSHQRGHTNVKLSLSKSSREDIETITGFCRELHDYSFVSKYYYHRKDRSIHMVLQPAPAIVRFFIGEWMEWFVFMKILNSLREHGIPVACLRGFHVNLPNGDRREIDGFFLIRNLIPLCVECKSGEFRQDIGKFSDLRRKLNLERHQLLVCAIGLKEAQIRGFNSMYDVTFANEANFLQHVRQLVQ